MSGLGTEMVLGMHHLFVVVRLIREVGLIFLVCTFWEEWFVDSMGWWMSVSGKGLKWMIVRKRS